VKPKAATTKAASTAPAKKKLSFNEAREYEAMENTISEKETVLHDKRDSVQDVAMNDPRSLEQLYKDIEAAQDEIDTLYARWAELESKIS
jgi:ATP-binding cassette subfamily F protein uup